LYSFLRSTNLVNCFLNRLTFINSITLLKVNMWSVSKDYFSKLGVAAAN